MVLALDSPAPAADYDPPCEHCGGRCRSSVEAFRRCCDRCTLRGKWHGEHDPAAARAFLRGWMLAHYGVRTGAELAVLEAPHA